MDTKEVSRSSERYFVRVSRTEKARDECRRLYLLGWYNEVNCCVENYKYVHRRLLYRDVGENVSTPEIQKAARPIPVGRRRKQRQAEQAELRQT
jgi:hypothetical protein